MWVVSISLKWNENDDKVFYQTLYVLFYIVWDIYAFQKEIIQK